MKLENTSPERIAALTVAQRAYFGSGATLGFDFRREQLRRLDAALKRWERPLCEALWQDLHKSEEEAVLTELSIVAGEIRNHLRHLKRWMRWERRPTPLKMFPSRSRIVSEPLGCSLIVAPWNYPVQLLLNPLVGAISAGCTALLKPSPYVPNVSLAIERMVSETFDERYIAVVQGNREVNGCLLGERYDVIFFTGSPSLGRIVMRAAAENLTPVVLELGGKSPCIVDRGADVELAARRIVWGKTLNAGQTCVAPDYVLADRKVIQPLIDALKKEAERMFSATPLSSTDLPRIINERHFERIKGLIAGSDIAFGGASDKEERKIEPTVLYPVRSSDPVMQEEIFGPVLPILAYDSIDDAIDFVRSREKPLALYIFSRSEENIERIHSLCSFGGGCVNDTVVHLSNPNMPFGGVGHSGMGSYHAKQGFDTFTHEKSTLDAVIEARNRAGMAGSLKDRADAEAGLSGALTKLFALAENYPDLKANQNFVSLQNELSGIEEGILNSRKYYNAVARELNDRIMMFPSSLIASVFHFGKRDYIEADDAERARVDVRF